MSDNADPYATPRANLRENVKTMSTILAGTAGAVIAGSPFSGIGALDPATLRFALASGGLLTVAVCLFLGWKALTFMLRPDLLDPIILRDSYTDEAVRKLGLPAAETDELIEVKAEFNRSRGALLPENIKSYEAFESYLDGQWVKLTAAEKEVAQKTLDAAVLESLRKRFDHYERNLQDIGFWATVTRLRKRVERGLRKVQILGMASLVALLVFAWAANPPKKDDASLKPTVIQAFVSCASCPLGQPPVQTARRVTFPNNSHELDPAAYAVLNEVAAVLRQQPDMGVLLLAHTDMVAGDKLNRALAARRADAVRRALQAQGGIAANRIFASELPKAALPTITGPEIANADNRSVELHVVPLLLPSR